MAVHAGVRDARLCFRHYFKRPRVLSAHISDLVYWFFHFVVMGFILHTKKNDKVCEFKNIIQKFLPCVNQKLRKCIELQILQI